MSIRILYSSGRIVFIQLIILIGLLSLLGRLVYLQIYQDIFLDDQVFNRLDSQYSLLAPRGKILDRNGNVLALDIKGYSVGIDLEKFKFEEEIITFLSKLLDKDFLSLSNMLYGKSSGYKEISRNINFETKENLKDKKIPGMYFRENLRRSYPERNITSHVVGLTDIDRKGIQGVELIFNNELRGEEGSFEGIKGAKNTKLEGKRISAVSGKNITLTIDINIQSTAYHQLNEAIKANNAKAGSIVVIEPKSGDILGLVNYPSFDPSNRKNLVDMSRLRNRATIDIFEPGSVLKPLAMSAILESDYLPKISKIDTSPGWIEYEGFKTSDFKDYGELSLSQIISLSSNVGMVKLCQYQDIEHLTNYYKKFGIGRYPTSIMLPAREGFLPHSSQFTLRDKVSSCYGYGMTLSALQIAQAYSVFANEGNFIELNLFKDHSFDEPLHERVLQKETNDIILDMLVETVNSSNGTASKARLLDKIVAGKTGTAKESLEEETTYSATFAGFVPHDEPELLAVVVLNGLSGEEYSGGKVSAPVFSRLMQQIFMLQDLKI
ncbi:penicillin-binding protein 2 [Gammaproteobacteria bacterium]|nr:penicillin-binding protein 2 [Gammaproteobacteria bacterium]